MKKIRLTSEFSAIPVAGGELTVSISRGDGTEIYRNTHNTPIAFSLGGVDLILEEDLRRQGVMTADYTLTLDSHDQTITEEFTAVYCEIPGRRAETAVFLVDGDSVIYPPGLEEDVTIPVMSPNAGEVECQQLWMEEGTAHSASLNIPVGAGIDYIEVYSSTFTRRPYVVKFTYRGETLTLIFPEKVSDSGRYVFSYRDRMNMERYLYLPGVTSMTPKRGHDLVMIEGRYRKIIDADETSHTHSCEALTHDIALRAVDLLKSREVTFGGREIVVTDVSGDIDNDTTKLNNIKITFRYAADS